MMNDLTKKFKLTTIPAISIEGYCDGDPISLTAIATIPGMIEDVVSELSSLLVGPTPDLGADDDTWDKFDWAAHDEASEKKHIEITPQVLAIIWEHLSEKDKENSDWEFDYDEGELNEEMKTFFVARQERMDARETAWEAENEEALQTKGIK